MVLMGGRTGIEAHKGLGCEKVTLACQREVGGWEENFINCIDVGQHSLRLKATFQNPLEPFAFQL